MQHWQRSDTEAVACCVCHREGRPIYDLDPFGVVRCPRCSMVFVSPRLTGEARRRRPAPEPERRVFAATVLQRNRATGQLTLAEQAAGRRAQGSRLLALAELPPRVAEQARRRGYDVVTAEPGDGADLPGDPPADVVWVGDALAGVADPVQLWRAVRAAVAADGVAVFSTPYVSSLPARVLRRRWRPLDPAAHVWQFTPRTHRRVAAEGGMEVVRLVLSPASRANLGRLDRLVGVARPAAAR